MAEALAPAQEPVQTSGVVLVSDGQPVLSQPFLLDEEMFALRPDLVKRAKVFLHTGKIVERDDELVQALCEAILLGKSLRSIAREHRVSRNTLHQLREELETAGKLEPHKRRISKKLGRLQEATLDSLIDKAERGTLQGNIEVIGLGVATDKKGQIDAGVVPGTERLEPELDPEAIRQQWERMKRANSIPVESQSDGTRDKDA